MNTSRQVKMNPILSMKDFILYRIQECNIIVLIGKFTVDFEGYYRDKLLLVGSNSSNTCYITSF